MQTVWPSIIAVLGTLFGATLAFVFQRSAAARADEAGRRQQRRTEMREAVAQFANTATQLRRAEYDRARKRLAGAPASDAEAARQETYRLRGEGWYRYYVLRLLADPTADGSLVESAGEILTLSRRITAGPRTDGELQAASSAASEALEGLVDAANQRLHDLE